jgi:hypothetical protein
MEINLECLTGLSELSVTKGDPENGQPRLMMALRASEVFTYWVRMKSFDFLTYLRFEPALGHF